MSFDDPFQPGQVLGSLRDVVRELDGKIGAQRYMMLGALVRDHHLRRVFQEEPRTRRTRDFDFAVVVPDEAAYAGVLTTGEPAAGALAVRRRIRDLPVDILPIFHGGDQTKWAADGITWDLLGLLEAWEGSQVLDLGDGASVRIPTLPAMIALKIVAWGAREDRKDAGDLRLLLAAAVEEGRRRPGSQMMLSCWAARGSKAISVRSRRIGSAERSRHSFGRIRWAGAGSCSATTASSCGWPRRALSPPTERPSGGIAR